MMLRSLVKKFKSHTLNEESTTTTPETGDDAAAVDDRKVVGSPQQLSVSISDAGGSHLSSDAAVLTTTSNSSTTASASHHHHVRGLTPQNDNSRQHLVDPATDIGQPPRQHYLRSSSGCACSRGETVSSIATRLRSCAAAAATGGADATAPMILERQQQQHGRYHRQKFYPCTRGSCSSVAGGGGSSFHSAAGSKTIGGGFLGGPVVMEDACSRDSGTESDDEELEQIETYSTRSVPVSHTSDYYTSQQSLSINSCRSSHCSSPLLGLSDQECNSGESNGSESGISVQAPGGSRHRQHRRHDQQQCHHHQRHSVRSSSNAALPTAFSKYSSHFPNFDTSTMIAAAVMQPPSEMMTEELPQHPYHTRQQFQRLTQQISIKNGIFSSTDSSSSCAERSVTKQENNNNVFTTADAALSTANAAACGGETTGSGSGRQPTAFIPVRRQEMSTTTQLDQSPEGAGSSSLDELEELNFGGRLQQRSSRRSRVAAHTSGITAGAGGGTCCGLNNEKRKWSHARQEQKRPPATTTTTTISSGTVMGGNTSVFSSAIGDRKRPVVQAARKTPVKLLFSLYDSIGGDVGVDDQRMTPTTIRSSIKFHSQQQLPHQAPVSPPVGISSNTGKQLRSARKRSKPVVCGDYGSERTSGDDEDQHRGGRSCNKDEGDGDDDDQDDDEDIGRRPAKRPSLDFDKMIGKLVGDSAASAKKKTKRVVGKVKCGSTAKSTLKKFCNRREGYQLRSTHRRCCLFRPLELPTSATTTTSARNNNSNSLDIHGQSSSSSSDAPAFSFQPQQCLEESRPPWQQGLTGTFYFGSNAPS